MSEFNPQLNGEVNAEEDSILSTQSRRHKTLKKCNFGQQENGSSAVNNIPGRELENFCLFCRKIRLQDGGDDEFNTLSCFQKCT